MQTPADEYFLERFSEAFQEQKLIKLVISHARHKKADLRNLIITPVMLKKGMRVLIVYRYTTKDITRNFSLEEALPLLKTAMEEDFYNGDLFVQGENIKLLISPSGKKKIKKQFDPAFVPLSLEHDRQKQRLIETHDNIYLKELGITNAEGEVRHEMKDKYLQINRYVELLEPEIRQLPPKDKLTLADMGSGKGYLTFALYDYLHKNYKGEITMTGVEFREDLVNTCNLIAAKANFNGLQFVRGTIEDTSLENPDILIALHACDTATDDAIFRGIKAQSSLIVCAPCCHKQIRKEFAVTSELSSVLKHGILEERQAEIITDGLRALLMEAWGYKTRVFEFISTEHTPKNVMIVGRKTKEAKAPDKKILDTIARVKSFYGIGEHYLEKLLSQDMN